MITSERMEIANRVLVGLIQVSNDANLYLEAYSNGREQGYNITNMLNSRRVSFGEYRNADIIAIYCGMYSDFSMQGNAPNEQVYHNARFFELTDIEGTAQAIYNYLLDQEGKTNVS